MYCLNESERSYRHGDHGPKYVMEGPRSNFGTVRLRPGDVVAAHVHDVMEEDFFVLEGQPTYVVGDYQITAEVGDFVHIEPGEVHVVENRTDAPCRFVVCTAPFVPGGDKRMV